MSMKFKNFVFLCLITLPTCTNVAVAQTQDTTKQIEVLKSQLDLFKTESRSLEIEISILEKRVEACSRQSEKCNAAPIAITVKDKKEKLEYNYCKIKQITLDISVQNAIRREESLKKRDLSEDEYSEIRNAIIQKEGVYYECEISEK